MDDANDLILKSDRLFLKEAAPIKSGILFRNLNPFSYLEFYGVPWQNRGGLLDRVIMNKMNTSLIFLR